jgi:hypothetical protein
MGRRSVKRGDNRDGHRDRDGQRQIAEQLPFHVLEKQHRHEHRHGGRGGREQRTGHLMSAFAAGLIERHPLLA